MLDGPRTLYVALIAGYANAGTPEVALFGCPSVLRDDTTNIRSRRITTNVTLHIFCSNRAARLVRLAR
jgi:hypothetical protein